LFLGDLRMIEPTKDELILKRLQNELWHAITCGYCLAEEKIRQEITELEASIANKQQSNERHNSKI